MDVRVAVAPHPLFLGTAQRKGLTFPTVDRARFSAIAAKTMGRVLIERQS
jgi:hypothetical protein